MKAKLVLLVEDEPDAVDIGTTILRHHGYRVLVADTGEEAIALAHEHHPDVIVMDVMLPGADGWVTTERLRDSSATAGIPILMLTVRAMAPDRDKSFAAGADSYISKPVDPKRILEEIERLIGTATSAD